MDITLNNELLRVCVSNVGAQLMNITYGDTELLWQGDPSVWCQRSPLLFPIVGRLKDDKLKYEGKEYTLTKHGFAQDAEFSLKDASSSRATFVLTSNESTKKVFPFDFTLCVTYQLHENHLTVSYEVLNSGTGNLYFSIGGHPGFNCKIGDVLMFEKPETADRLVMNENFYISERKPFLKSSNEIVLTEHLFDDDALIFEGLESTFVTLKTQAYPIKLTYNKSSYLGIWAKPRASYVCIEPWFGIDDSVDAACDFHEKKGIVVLVSEETFNYEYDIEIIGAEKNDTSDKFRIYERKQ